MKCPNCNYDEKPSNFNYKEFIELEVTMHDEKGNPCDKTIYACPKCGILFMDV